MTAPRSTPNFAELARRLGREVPQRSQPVVCVQGLGFVGAGMCAAVASAAAGKGDAYDVIGVDLPTPEGQRRADAILEGVSPFPTTDVRFADALRDAKQRGNLIATTDETAFQLASIVVVDVPLDVRYESDGFPNVDWSGFRAAIDTVATHMPAGGMILIETTVPPGTCEFIAKPQLTESLARRGLAEDALLLAHSYERVMPGPDYFRSITHFWRVYSATTPAAERRCEEFLSRVIDTDQFPLTRLASTTACETAKILENSYRATNIAFIEEWGRFAEQAGFDLFAVLDAIRMRPTHNNIRQPGFGVGGYCLTKDPEFADIAARRIFGLDGVEFEISRRAVAINTAMPLVTLGHVERLLGASLSAKSILLAGISYRPGVGDTRFSPAETFAREAIARGADMHYHDPLVGKWMEMDTVVQTELPSAKGLDAVVFAVPHPEYGELDVVAWLAGSKPILFDANDALTQRQRDACSAAGSPVYSIGRGLPR